MLLGKIKIGFAKIFRLQAGLDAGHMLPYSCRAGVCRTCRGTILEGKVDYGLVHDTYLPESDKAKGYALLCQATADRTGLPVLAGPVEATALGNALVQARAAGLVHGDLETLRALVARHYAPVRYEPSRVSVR